MISRFVKFLYVFQIVLCIQRIVSLPRSNDQNRVDEWDPTLLTSLQVNNQYDLIKKTMEKMLTDENNQDISSDELKLVSTYLNMILNSNSNKKYKPAKIDYWLLRQGR
jgi:hypothetical protein